MTDRELLQSMSSQISELVRNVAEVRRSNISLQEQFGEMRDDVTTLRDEVTTLRDDVTTLRDEVTTLSDEVTTLRDDVTTLRDEVTTLHRSLDEKIDEKTDFVVGKIDHFIGAFHKELAGDRIRFEEDRYVRGAKQRKTDKRLDDIESRLDRLEAATL